MSRTFTDLWKDASELSEKDRADLAGLLIESLEGGPDEEIEAAWAAEIERRVAELERRKIYEVIGDAGAEAHNQLRVIDESGEDYLFPAKYFAVIELPAAVRRALAA